MLFYVFARFQGFEVFEAFDVFDVFCVFEVFDVLGVFEASGIFEVFEYIQRHLLLKLLVCGMVDIDNILGVVFSGLRVV